jgi:uncharacterized membrane protein YidH (DUF202 family)
MPLEPMSLERDSGLHAERTILAWRRTSIAVMLGLPLIARSFEHLGVVATALVSAPVIVALWLIHSAITRRQRNLRTSDRTSATFVGVGPMAAGIAGAAAVIAVSAFIAVLGGMP